MVIPVRQSQARAIVVSVNPVTDNKTALRSATFTLKKLPPQNTPISTVPENILKTAHKLTTYYPASLGSILYQLLPPEIRSGEYNFPTVSSLQHAEDTTPKIITGRREDRLVSYRSHVRSILAKRGSVLVVLPTSIGVLKMVKELSTGISDRIVVFHSEQTKRQRLAAHEAFADTSLAKVIITTPSHAYLDRVDLLSFIIDEEASEQYRDRERPYLDHRFCLITHSAATGRSLLIGDILPRAETEHARREDRYFTPGEEIKRHTFQSIFTIISQKRETTTAANFSLFTSELKKRIGHTLAQRGRVFLYGARRGLAPVVICNDCGFVFRCPDSGSPYSLLRTHSPQGNEERWFISTTSGKRLRAADTCEQCGSWRLREQGIGVQTIQNECGILFPDTPCLLLDYQTGSTTKRAQTLLQKFYSTPSSILIGTHLALPYLTQTGIDLAAIVSLDAVRATPTWRVDELTLRLLFTLRDLAHKEVLVQTKNPEDSLLNLAQTGMLQTFYTDELDLRQSLGYPPFSTFVLLSWQGTAAETVEIENLITKLTAEFSPSYYSHPHSSATKTIRYGLFRVQNDHKKMAGLLDPLRQLPPVIKIEINPSRIV